MGSPMVTWELYTKRKYDQRKGSLSSPMKARLFLLIHMEKIRPNYTLWLGTEVADSPQAFSFFPQLYRYRPLEPRSWSLVRPLLGEMDQTEVSPPPLGCAAIQQSFLSVDSKKEGGPGCAKSGPQGESHMLLHTLGCGVLWSQLPL